MLIGRGILFIVALREKSRVARLDKADAGSRTRDARARPLTKVAEAASRYVEAHSELGPEIRRAPRGHRLNFEYADQHGEVTVRSITQWVEHSDHIRGWCAKRRAVRTFRKDHVLDWISGSTALRSP